MYTKEFHPFVWEEELQKLSMPHFYLGIFSYILLFNFLTFILFLFQHLFFLLSEVEFQS